MRLALSTWSLSFRTAKQRMQFTSLATYEIGLEQQLELDKDICSHHLFPNIVLERIITAEGKQWRTKRQLAIC